MSVNIRSEVKDVILNGAVLAGVGFLGAKWSKTNVVAAVIIGGCQGITDATFGKVIKHCLGEEARNAKIILAVGNCLIGTIAIIASVAFGAMSMSSGVFSGVFVLGYMGWQLFAAIKPEQADAFISKLMSGLLPQPPQQEQQVDSSDQPVSVDLSKQTEVAEAAQTTTDGVFVEIDLNADSKDPKEKLQQVLSRTINERFEELTNPRTSEINQLVAVECN